MLEVDGILPSPLTPLVLAPTIPEPVYEMQTSALFAMVHSSPQPQSVDTANYARVNPLPSPATSSSSSGELHLHIDSDTISPSVPAGLQSSSQELPLQRTSQVPQQPLLFSTTHTQQYPHQNHKPSLRAFSLGLMKWPQRYNQVTPHQRRLSPIRHTLVGSVEHDHDHSRWSTHRQ